LQRIEPFIPEEDLEMRQRIARAVALVVVGLLTGAAAFSQTAAPPTLKEQLEAQYKVSGVYTNGTVNPAGTILVVQMNGIHGFPPDNTTVTPATYKDGTLHAPTGKSKFVTRLVDVTARPGNATSGGESRPFRIGEKVYVTKIEVNLKSKKQDSLRFSIFECGACNGVDQASSYKALVDFDFAKGYLQTASVPDVEDTIAKVLAIDTSASETPQAAQPAQPAAEQAVAAPAPPASIQLGQTPEQVVAALGQPEKTVNLGSKQIYVYKDLKVTFINGKVSDVQ
jgi:hypothetical protein